MSLPNYKEIINLSTLEETEKEIYLLQKNLFDLRIKRATSQSVKPHLFTHAKRRLAQLQFKKMSFISTTKI
jgi:large subunit ribosomal protein L29